jgi:hypothetical protein
MKITLFLLSLLASLAAPLDADTIYQTSAQGKQVVVQRDAIVVGEDSSFLVYKHFDLKDRRVEIVRLNRGSLPYSVETSSPDNRRQIVDIWKRFGHKATVTDLAGKTTRVFDVYVDFYPPGGRGSLLESLPPTTSFTVLMENGSADEVEFSKIDHLEIQDDHLKMTLRNGQVEQGKFLMPTNQPAEVRFLGITEQYNAASEQVFDFSLPLAKIKEIRFD